MSDNKKHWRTSG